MFVTEPTFNIERSNVVNDEHPLNIEAIDVTDEMLKPVKSNDVNDEQLSNIPAIDVTDEVLKFDKSNVKMLLLSAESTKLYNKVYGVTDDKSSITKTAGVTEVSNVAVIVFVMSK